MKKIAPGSSEDMGRVVGLTIVEANVRVQSVEFVFLHGNAWVFVQIYKKFSYTLPDGRRGSFDPAAEYGQHLGDSGDFIMLRGAKADAVQLDESALLITLQQSGNISLFFEERDFDPLQIWGLEGPNREAIVFWHVV